MLAEDIYDIKSNIDYYNEHSKLSNLDKRLLLGAFYHELNENMKNDFKDNTVSEREKILKIN